MPRILKRGMGRTPPYVGVFRCDWCRSDVEMLYEDEYNVKECAGNESFDFQKIRCPVCATWRTATKVSDPAFGIYTPVLDSNNRIIRFICPDDAQFG